jgi:long-chain acyl-CoA synthetase
MVIISPHFPVLEDWARANDVSYTNHAGLIAEPRVKALFDGIVADVNQRLAQFETLKKVLLVPEEFSIANGTLTPSQKVRRRFVEDMYKREINAIYEEPSPAKQTVGS